MDTNSKVLFIDDQQEILEAVKRLFINKPFDVLTAGSGAAGLEIIKNDPVAVIITDIDMPTA